MRAQFADRALGHEISRHGCSAMRKLVVDVLGELAPAYPLVANRSSAVMISFAITLQLLHS
jgi:hypothetical protein